VESDRAVDLGKGEAVPGLNKALVTSMGRGVQEKYKASSSRDLQPDVDMDEGMSLFPN
jgi:hypothetical protein